MSIPTIDLAAGKGVPHALEGAFKEVGFLQLVNAGIDAALLAKAFTVAEQFFSYPLANKQQFLYQAAAENFGYQGVLQENLDPRAPADIKETFTMRNILNNPVSEQRWPSQEFKRTMQDLFHNALAVTYQLQAIIAELCQLPTDFFTRKHLGENISLRLLHYPPVPPEQVDSQQLGAGAHSDYGFITLLFQDDVGGLQVMDKNNQNQWLDAVPVPGTVVINSGDLLEQWTNGQYQSTVHRVQPVTGQRSRYSIAFFVDPDDAVWVEPLPAFVDDNHPSRYPGTTAKDHILKKLNQSHKDRF